MNQHIGELRNMVVLMSKRMEGLEHKLKTTSDMANRAKHISQIVQEFQFKEIHDKICETEFHKIHKLFSGASPCFEETLQADDSESDSETEMFGSFKNMFDAQGTDDTFVEEIRAKAIGVAKAAACEATKIASEATAAVEAMASLDTSDNLLESNVPSEASSDTTSPPPHSSSLVSNMTNKLLSSLYQPSDTDSS